MIPLRLSIKNFVSYGLQEINFEPYHLICLAGKNGHGKSALLDALTWAIWGQARKTAGSSKADEGLLRLGQTHMMVTLDVLCNSSCYRIKREYTLQAQKSYSSLEFGILDSATDTLRPLTDKTIRATQDKINQIIGLDYDSFINSAFLRQGHSNEFSKKTPRERKEVLATILGLDHFEQVRRQALDKVNEAHATQQLCQPLVEQLTQEVSQKKVLDEEINATESLLSINLQKTELTQKAQQESVQKLSKISHLKAELSHASSQQSQLISRLQIEIDALKSAYNSWRTIQTKTRKNTVPQDDYQQLQQELSRVQTLASHKIKMSEELLLKREMMQQWYQTVREHLKGNVDQNEKQRHRYEVELATLAQKKTDLQSKQTSLKNEAQELIKMATHEKERILSESQLEMIKTLEKLIERRKAYFHTFASKASALSNQRESIEQKERLVGQLERPLCPLCEQETDRAALVLKFEKEKKLVVHRLERLTKIGKTLKERLLENRAAYDLLKKQESEGSIAQAHIAQIENKIGGNTTQEQTVLKELNELTVRAAELLSSKDSLSKEGLRLKEALEKSVQDPLYKEKEQELATLKNALDQLPQTEEQQVILAAKLTTVQKEIQEHHELIKEGALQAERKKFIVQKIQYIRELKLQRELLHKTSTDLELQISIEPQLLYEHQNLVTTLEALMKEKESCLEKKGSLEAQRIALYKKEEELKALEKRLEECAIEVDDYSAIATAVSKDGIQALLIEDALPEIEAEANDLLSRLTDNQAHITIESLRDLKSGKTKETLDIKISDAVGVRPYELFSGGEAFRIDFALRIALSKLLARRAGTALQTLIIDEGFGSQDEDGLANIMQALYKIQDDFAKILIVSHLSALKEQFPVHFLIQKNVQGSTVSVVEHC
jgi:DNA repair protein SbcC/Rad50